MGETATQAEFQDQIAARLRSDIGGLIPDAMLADLVQRAIEDMFFKPRGDTFGTKRSWFQVEVEELMTSAVKKQVETYFDTQSEAIVTVIEEQIREQLPRILATTLMGGFNNAGYQLGTNLADSMSDGIRLALQHRGVI